MAHSSDSHVHLHPLLLPEILNVLGPFLQRNSLLCSLRVCKTWHRTLEPQLWHTVSTARKNIYPFGIPARTLALTPRCTRDDSLKALLRNLSHIRAIYFNDQEFQDYYPHYPSSASSDLKSLLLQCRNLTMLQLKTLSDEMMTLLEHNRNTIQRIIYSSSLFDAVQQKATTDHLWNILGSMTRLRHLELQTAMKDSLRQGQNPTQGEAFARVCDKLETMRLISCTLGDWPDFEQGGQGQQGRFSKMKQLEFISVKDVSAQLQMIRQCPVLEDLAWCSGSGSMFPTQDFVHHLCLTRSTSCLKRLKLEGFEMPDADFAAIIAQLPASCNHLTFNSIRFGLLSIAALAATPKRRDFSLRLTRGIRSHLIHGLLSRCPNLQYLLPSCQVIATDLLAAPWVASRLVKLELTLSFEANLAPDLGHSVIYEQLSRLVSLQELCLSEERRALSGRWFGQEIEISEGLLGYNHKGLDFSLENGMGALASLSQLRRLDLRALRVLRMGQAEALWMTTHWPALTSLYVRGFHHDSREQREVLEFLGKRRPELDIAIGPKGDSQTLKS